MSGSGGSSAVNSPPSSISSESSSSSGGKSDKGRHSLESLSYEHSGLSLHRLLDRP